MRIAIKMSIYFRHAYKTLWTNCALNIADNNTAVRSNSQNFLKVFNKRVLQSNAFKSTNCHDEFI